MLAVIHNLADNRVGIYSDFHQIKSGCLGGSKGFSNADNPDLLPVSTY